MASVTHAATRGPYGSASSLVSSGLSEAQAAAVLEIVRLMVNAEVEALRDELSRWQLYLALALLTQIGLVLLVVLMTRALLCPDAPAHSRLSGALEPQQTDTRSRKNGESPVNCTRFDLFQVGTGVGRPKILVAATV